MLSIFHNDGEFVSDTGNNNQCPKCDGVGSVLVRVIHVYPDGDETDTGKRIVDCDHCDATGRL